MPVTAISPRPSRVFTKWLAGPDREPAGPYGAYTDYIAPRYNGECSPCCPRASPSHWPGPIHRYGSSRSRAALSRSRRARITAPMAAGQRHECGNADAAIRTARRVPGRRRPIAGLRLLVRPTRSGARWRACLPRTARTSSPDDVALRHRRRRASRNEIALDALRCPNTRAAAPQTPSPQALRCKPVGVPAYPVQNSAGSPACRTRNSRTISTTSFAFPHPERWPPPPSRARARASRPYARQELERHRADLWLAASQHRTQRHPSATTTNASPSSLIAGVLE